MVNWDRQSLGEALVRIEHKLDCLLDVLAILQSNTGFPPLSLDPMLEGRRCPICLEKVRYIPDPSAGMIIRQCGCKTGKMAFSLIEESQQPQSFNRVPEIMSNESEPATSE